MKQAIAKRLFTELCQPALGVANEEELPGMTPLYGMVAVAGAPPYLSIILNSDKENKLVADFLRKWANAIEGKGFKLDGEVKNNET